MKSTKQLKCTIVFLGLIFLHFLASRDALYCQHTGFKYFKNYSSGLHPQNWSIVQDQRGIIYVANNGGVLEYDGVHWRTIKIPNWKVRSLGMDNYGTVYIGGLNEIGFLVADTKSSLQYVSLLNRLANDQKNFSDVWRINSTREGIYFRTSYYLIRWNPHTGKIKVWKSKTGFIASFNCHGRLFVQEKNVGLMQMVNDSLKIIPGNEPFVTTKIYMMAPYDEQRILMGTQTRGFYLYEGTTASPFPTEVDDYIKSNQLYYGIRLVSSPGDFALATLRGGLVIIDLQGRLKEIFTKPYGLQCDDVKSVFEDFQGSLWLALDKGISKIEYVSPISIYDDNRSGLAGSVLSVTRHGPQSDLYVGTTGGLYFFPPSSKLQGTSRPVPGISFPCFSLLSIGDSILAAGTDGVFQVERKNNRQTIHKIHNVSDSHAYILERSLKEPDRTWVGTRQGLILLRLDSRNSQWVEEHRFEFKTPEVKTIVEDKKGNLWLGTLGSGVLKVDFRGDGTISEPMVTPYDTSHGLPPGPVRTFFAAGHIIFASSTGIFHFDKKNQVFVKDYTLGKNFADGPVSIFRMAEDRYKNIWFHSEFRNFLAAAREDGTFVLDKRPFLRVPLTQVNVIYTDPVRDTVWFGSNDGLIRFDNTIKKNYRRDFSTFIRKVVVNGEPVFDGFPPRTDNDSQHPFLVVKYKDRNFRFEFAAPFFEDETANRYRCFLEGYDQDWSNWNSEPQMIYTNLDAGTYRFRVQAKNVYQHLSREDVFQFKVLAPWHLTWWAFLIDVLLFFLAIYLVVKWRSRKLEHEKQQLEKIVKNRTKEIDEKNRQLEWQTLQLQEQSGKLREMDQVKSRFFANISHEFRTPLTLIMGPLEQMLAREKQQHQKEQLNLMLRNSHQLLMLINQLLDLSKLDSGQLKLQAGPQNIISFIKGIISNFESLAAQNRLNLTYHAKDEDIIVYFDPGKMEQIMGNLLVNAVKFTPPGGEIGVSVTVYSPDIVEISVRDTGMGIPKEQLDRIFDRFYQADSSLHRGIQQIKGTGIGLALTKELVVLHHGNIDVHSRMGENSGTEFIIRLPLGKDHLQPGEITDAPASSSTYPNREPMRIPLEESNTRAEEIEEEDRSDPEKQGTREKNIILVVEDNPDVREYIRGPLQPDYTVVEAADGKEGIHKAKTIIPDLVISDIMMPGTDGYELCRTLKKDIKTSHIPVILLTAKASEESIIEGLETGADDYITKPFSTRILEARVKNLIELRRQLHIKMNREMTLQPAEISVSSMDQKFLKELQEMIEKNLADPGFNVEQLANKLYMSQSTLYRKILALTGETVTEFIRSYRLKRAAQLLKARFGNVTEVAFEVGFSNTAYFTKCFKKKFHRLPSQFQAAEAS
jgi:signal transduction histidine kinase/DNA-binding NarL/FixJ family response regulator